MEARVQRDRLVRFSQGTGSTAAQGDRLYSGHSIPFCQRTISEDPAQWVSLDGISLLKGQATAATQGTGYRGQ